MPISHGSGAVGRSRKGRSAKTATASFGRRFAVDVARRARIDGLVWRTRLGCDDACLTALAVGLAWAVKGTAVAAATRAVAGLREPPRLRIVPVDRGWVLESRCRCILTCSTRDIMVAATSALRGGRAWTRWAVRSRTS